MFKPFSINIRGKLIRYTCPAVMGIVNITPDSFFEGSRTISPDTIARRVEKHIAEGADILDVGAYSSRPGAGEVSLSEEIDRLARGMEIIRSIAPDIPVSIDTFRSEVARVAVSELGADIINDISGGDLDNNMFSTVAELGTPYIVMHMRGTPATMQNLTDYGNVTAEVIKTLSEKIRALRLLGVSDIIADPGFGFAKTTEQNFKLLGNLESLVRLLDAPVLVGISRKSMLTRTLDISSSDALNATTVVNTIALVKGASILRVHDVAEAVQAVRLNQLSQPLTAN